MWALKKPTLATAKADLTTVIQHAQKLRDADKPALEQLYDEYDAKGYCTDAELSVISKEKSDSLLKQYPKTYGKGDLHFIADQLKSGITICPYCGFNGIQQLDHFMNKAAYKALAVCRLNLVPSCGDCNLIKDAVPFDQFIHPYYHGIPANTIFLKCDVTINKGALNLHYHSDRGVLTKAVADRIDSHINKLELDRRLLIACNDFLTSLLTHSFARTEKGLRRIVIRELKVTEKSYKKNDWRCALLRGLLTSPSFNLAFTNSYIGMAVNNGEGL